MIALGALDRGRQRGRAQCGACWPKRCGRAITSWPPSPAAALCLTHEYPSLVDDDDARLVADNTSEACTYLWKLHQAGNLQLDFRPVNVVLGLSFALPPEGPGGRLARRKPAAADSRPGGQPHRRRLLGHGGHVWPESREHYRASLRAGRDLINAMRSPRIQAGVTECSACKMQMEQGTDKPTMHPLKALALAYDLMPEVADLWPPTAKTWWSHESSCQAICGGAWNWRDATVSNLKWPKGTVLATCGKRWARRSLDLAPWLPHLLFAVGTEYAADGAIVRQGDEIACIPPVSGG